MALLIALFICAIIATYAAVRVVLEKRPLRKLPYLNVLSFAVSGSLLLILPHPLSIVVAVAYFVGTTLESNAIASTFAGGIRKDG